MPQVVFKNVSEEIMEKISPDLINKLAEAIKCEKDWLSFELIPIKIYKEEGSVPHYPIVQVWWFDRDKATKDMTARILADTLLDEGHKTVQVTFHTFDKEAYYEINR